MSHDQLREFEDRVRRVGRKGIPPEWRAEILEAARRGPGDRKPAPGPRAAAVEASDVTDALERRVRRAERRAVWSMAACLVATLFLVALVLGPRLGPRAAQGGSGEESARQPTAGGTWAEEWSLSSNDAEVMPGSNDLGDIPPPPSPSPPPLFAQTAPAEPGEDGEPPGLPAVPKAMALEEWGGELGSAKQAASEVTSRVASSFGQHSDSAVWDKVAVQGGVFAGKVANDEGIALERLASRSGVTLSEASTIGGGGLDPASGEPLNRERRDAGEGAEPSGSPEGGRHARLGDIRRQYERAAADSSSGRAQALSIDLEGQLSSLDSEAATAVRPLDLRSSIDDGMPGDRADLKVALEERNRDLTELQFRVDSHSESFQPIKASGGASMDIAANEGSEVSFSLIDRVPIITTSTAGSVVSNQVTEEVRYQIDAKDPVGDSTTQREIGVTLGVSPTLLPDGTIRLKMRPRSAQVPGEIVGQSGNHYPQVSESMIESIGRVPPGHSLVLGGFYGEVKSGDGNKVPLLGDIPAVSFFFKDKETAREPANLLFVVTPTPINDQVVIETKILGVDSKATEGTGVGWASSLGAAGVPPESIGSLSFLLGNESAPEEVDESDAAAGAGQIVLSPEQVKGVLEALTKGGLIRQISNPTVVAEASRQPGQQVTRRQRKALEDLEKSAADAPYSTFSLNVSDVSFKLAKASLARREWPAAGQLRVEEFVNAFDYGDPAPSRVQKVACHLEQAAHPFMQQRNLLRVSMKTAALGRSADTPLRLTVLLDRSGSMDRADRAESVKNAFQLLAGQLDPRDRVTLIGFARTPRLLADGLTGDRAGELAKVAASTPSEGGTNLEQALELGIAKAKEQMLEGGQNRIILMTDGAANLGNAAPEDLARLVESMRQQGIAFDACGVGADGLNDDILESLTRKGDGRYYFLDRPEDADDGFARQIAGALRPAARNVKVQVRFNPDRVGRYKLYGFEKHRLRKEDFRDDSVDAAELAAEEAGNAIYHVEVLPEGSGEIGTVRVRFQDTESGQMIERRWTIPYAANAPRLEQSAPSLRLAAAAALLGEKLRGGLVGEAVEMAPLEQLVRSLTAGLPLDERVKELVQMVRMARELGGG